MGYRSVFRLGLFADRHVVVTGGGSGIGRCTAHELAALGAEVALIGRKPERLEKTAAEIMIAGGAATIHPCDIRDEAAVQATVAEILAVHGRIDGLVNNAGGQFMADLADISLKGWEAVIRTNLTGGFLMARECHRRWMAENGGAIVNIIADMWGSMPTMAHSGAARAGMLSLTETAAVEWAPCGIRVNAVAPGWIASSGMDNYPPEAAPLIRRLKRAVPLQRLGTESEVSAAIVFLLSDAAAYITGTCLRVDGGAPNAKATWEMPAHERSTPYDGFHLASVPKVLKEE